MEAAGERGGVFYGLAGSLAEVRGYRVGRVAEQRYPALRPTGESGARS